MAKNEYGVTGFVGIDLKMIEYRVTGLEMIEFGVIEVMTIYVRTYPEKEYLLN